MSLSPKDSLPSTSAAAITASEWCSKDFYMIRRLGMGKHSEVYLAQDKSSGLLFAVKEMYKADILADEMGE